MVQSRNGRRLSLHSDVPAIPEGNEDASSYSDDDENSDALTVINPNEELIMSMIVESSISLSQQRRATNTVSSGSISRAKHQHDHLLMSAGTIWDDIAIQEEDASIDQQQALDKQQQQRDTIHGAHEALNAAQLLSAGTIWDHVGGSSNDSLSLNDSSTSTVTASVAIQQKGFEGIMDDDAERTVDSQERTNLRNQDHVQDSDMINAVIQQDSGIGIGSAAILGDTTADSITATIADDEDCNDDTDAATDAYDRTSDEDFSDETSPSSSDDYPLATTSEDEDSPSPTSSSDEHNESAKALAIAAPAAVAAAVVGTGAAIASAARSASSNNTSTHSAANSVSKSTVLANPAAPIITARSIPLEDELTPLPLGNPNPTVPNKPVKKDPAEEMNLMAFLAQLGQVQEQSVDAAIREFVPTEVADNATTLRGGTRFPATVPIQLPTPASPSGSSAPSTVPVPTSSFAPSIRATESPTMPPTQSLAEHFEKSLKGNVHVFDVSIADRLWHPTGNVIKRVSFSLIMQVDSLRYLLTAKLLP
jgi:hypothetical protein